MASAPLKGRQPKFHIGDVIRKRRQWLGLKLESVAEKAKMSKTTLSEIERGVGNATQDTLNRVAGALKTTTEDLYASVGGRRSEAPGGFERELLDRWGRLSSRKREVLRALIWELTEKK